MSKVDLHIHSTASDGSFTPAQVVRHAHLRGLEIIALTDHDSVHGLDEAFKTIEEEKIPLKLIPGIEMSSRYVAGDFRFEIHILGYNIDYKNPELNKKLDDIKEERRERNKEMLGLFSQFGYYFDIEELEKRYNGSTITRMHIAQFLLDEGLIKTKREAFGKYIGVKAPCYVPRVLLKPEDAFKLIIDYGGIPVLAHPVQYKLTPSLYDEMVEDLKENGLKGIEAIYTSNTAADERFFKRLEKDHDLFVTGGSDFHGAMKPNIEMGVGFGSLYIPDEVAHNIL